MKITALLSLAAAAGISIAYPQAGTTKDATGNVVVAGGLAPEVQELKPIGVFMGAKRVKIRYGPYRIPGTGETTLAGLASGEKGKMATVKMNLKKPCTSCGIISMLAGLEYTNGTQADVPSGSWLHHVVMLAGSNGRQDVVCTIGPLSVLGERFFSSGNERTPAEFADVKGGKLKSAFMLTATDTLNMQLELMNMDARPKDVYYTTEYEYVLDASKATGWASTKGLWLDVTGCGTSSVNAPANKQQFSYSMKPWALPWNATLFYGMPHLHDGGTAVGVYINGNKVCTSKANYAKAVAGAPSGHSHALMAREEQSIAPRDGPQSDGGMHISTQEPCTNMGNVKKGDMLTIDAEYDFAKYPGMKGNRGYTPLMGIVLMYAAAFI